MSTTGLDVFDKTLQTTNIWLEEMAGLLGHDRKRCYHAMTAVLHAIRDLLPLNEVAHLSAQMPILVRGIYFQGWNPKMIPERNRSLEEFLNHIQQDLQNIPPVGADEACRAVFSILDRHIGDGEMRQIKQILPEDVRRFWNSLSVRIPPVTAQNESEGVRH